MARMVGQASLDYRLRDALRLKGDHQTLELDVAGLAGREGGG
jgi:hypothetical protein